MVDSIRLDRNTYNLAERLVENIGEVAVQLERLNNNLEGDNE